MSLARVTTVTRAAKAYTCGHCLEDIAKGSPYRWYKVGFRSRVRYTRCMKAACMPRESELESSKLSGVYAALEAGHDDVDAATTIDEITEALSSAADAIRDVAGEYTEAADAMGEAGTEMAEKADALESAADDLEATSIPDPEECDRCEGSGTVASPSGASEVECPWCVGGVLAESLQESRDEAHEALNSFEMP